MMFSYAEPMVFGSVDRPYYFTLDRQYNVRGVVDRAGALREIYKYDEYGRLRIRESFGRGDHNIDSIFGMADATAETAVHGGSLWDPRSDIDDDGDVDSNDSTLLSVKRPFWPATTGATPTVSQAFSDFGNASAGRAGRTSQSTRLLPRPTGR